jgi:hypothetical protein
VALPGGCSRGSARTPALGRAPLGMEHTHRAAVSLRVCAKTPALETHPKAPLSAPRPPPPKKVLPGRGGGAARRAAADRKQEPHRRGTGAWRATGAGGGPPRGQQSPKSGRGVRLLCCSCANATNTPHRTGTLRPARARPALHPQASSAYKGALKEVLALPAIAAQIKDTKAAREVGGGVARGDRGPKRSRTLAAASDAGGAAPGRARNRLRSALRTAAPLWAACFHGPRRWPPSPTATTSPPLPPPRTKTGVCPARVLRHAWGRPRARLLRARPRPGRRGAGGHPDPPHIGWGERSGQLFPTSKPPIPAAAWNAQWSKLWPKSPRKTALSQPALPEAPPPPLGTPDASAPTTPPHPQPPHPHPPQTSCSA